MKTDPMKMILDGWCQDCDGDPARCVAEGRCIYDDPEDENGTEEKSI